MVRVQLVAILAMVPDTVKSQISERYLKVHSRAFQCFYIDFFAVENGGEETRPTSGRPWSHFFFFTLQSHSSLGGGWIWDIIKKVKTKRQVFPWTKVKNSWNSKQVRRAPRIDLEVSWSDAQFKTRDLSDAVVYISLHSTMYTTTIDRQDTLLSALRLERCTAAIIFPRTRWRKNHRIAWPCTLNFVLSYFWKIFEALESTKIYPYEPVSSQLKENCTSKS